MKIQDSSSLLEWNAQKASEEHRLKVMKLIDQSNDIHIVNLAEKIAYNKRIGESTKALEKELTDEITRVKKACDALLGYERKMTGYWLSERADKQMDDKAYERRLIKNQLNK